MFYKRDILDKIKKVLLREEFIILSGARQTGKTTLMRILKDYLEKSGHPCYYFNLENPEYLKLFNENTFNVFEVMPKDNVKQYIFIDEIQYLDDPSGFLKLLFDEKREQIKVVCSGSSSFYLDKKFKDSLAGRKFLFEIYPLNFLEFLLFKNEDKLLAERKNKLSLYYRKRLAGLWQEYLIFGGYPKIVLEENEEMKKVLLEEIGTSYIKKDIFDAGIRNEEKYFFLLKLLASQTGQLVNSKELSNTIGIAHKTVLEYLYVMKKSYQISFITPFYNNLRKELVKMPKVYFNDLGLRNFFLGDYSLIEKRSDRGAYLENVAFREFQKEVENVSKIKFWRTQDQKEVDFVVGEKAYEIKYDAFGCKEKKYEAFKQQYPHIEFSFLSASDMLKKFYGWKN